MSAATSYELRNSESINSPFITGEEATLLAAARNGDSAAFERLIMPHWDGLFRMTQRILRNREDAEDAVQTAFLDAFRNLKHFHGRSRFSSWLTRIAMNAAFMRLRAIRRKMEISIDDSAEDSDARPRVQIVGTRLNPEQEYLSNEARVLLAKGLEKLKPRYVEVLHLRNVQELSAKETARILDLPVGTVKARLHRARTTLARRVHSIVTRKRSRGSVGG